MTKVMEILYNRVHREYPEYDSADEASSHFAPTIRFVDAPDWVWPGYGYDDTKQGDERFVRPALNEGWEYDENGCPWSPEETRATERRRLHSETSDDTLEALRKIREGDQTIDWSAWLDQLDAYNLAIEATKTQEGYPLKVKYPEYPVKPAKNENGGGS